MFDHKTHDASHIAEIDCQRMGWFLATGACPFAGFRYRHTIEGLVREFGWEIPNWQKQVSGAPGWFPLVFVLADPLDWKEGKPAGGSSSTKSLADI